MTDSGDIGNLVGGRKKRERKNKGAGGAAPMRHTPGGRAGVGGNPGGRGFRRKNPRTAARRADLRPPGHFTDAPGPPQAAARPPQAVPARRVEVLPTTTTGPTP